jgi:hypothetical protein
MKIDCRIYILLLLLLFKIFFLFDEYYCLLHKNLYIFENSYIFDKKSD